MSVRDGSTTGVCLDMSLSSPLNGVPAYLTDDVASSDVAPHVFRIHRNMASIPPRASTTAAVAISVPTVVLHSANTHCGLYITLSQDSEEKPYEGRACRPDRTRLTGAASWGRAPVRWPPPQRSGTGSPRLPRPRIRRTQRPSCPSGPWAARASKVSILNLGTWMSPGGERLLRFAWANGIRYFDTAKSYGSEPMIGPLAEGDARAPQGLVPGHQGPTGHARSSSSPNSTSGSRRSRPTTST